MLNSRVKQLLSERQAPLTVRIFKPAKTTMQAGKRQSSQWILEFEKQGQDYIEPVMSWLGSKDMGFQIRIKFDTKEQAIAFAKEREWHYHLISPQTRKFHAKSYTNNFMRTNR